ncbi:TPA: hypothetical protein DD617_02830 [Candidatus Uhrbacteria bacterium]|jgi:hypothetical protein|nr:hypothetical protein [Candidatus Uhrbacteria bacterium]
MASIQIKIDARLSFLMTKLQILKKTQTEMQDFFCRLPSDKQACILSLLEREDEDLARLVIATVPKLKRTLSGSGSSPAIFVSSILHSIPE